MAFIFQDEKVYLIQNVINKYTYSMFLSYIYSVIQ